MFIIFLKLLVALNIGYLHAMYGSGETRKIWNPLNTFLKWFMIPVIMVNAVAIAGGGWLAIVYVLPYLWKMATGTGGDAQAYKHNTINNPKECWGLDQISHLLTKDIIGSFYHRPFFDYKVYKNYQSYNEEQRNEYCRLWGFWFCTLSAVIFTIPFLFTNYWYALPLLGYGFYHRYLERRQIEFSYTALSLFLFLLSL